MNTTPRPPAGPPLRPLRAPPRPAMAPLRAQPMAAAPARRYLPAAKWVLLLAILYTANAGFSPDVVFGSEGDAYAPSPIYRLIKLAALGLGLLLVLLKAPLAARLFRSLNRPMIAFFVLAGLSVVWSIDRGATIGRVITLYSIAGASLFYVLSGWHPRAFQRLVLPAAMLLLLGALLAAQIDYSIVVEPGDTVSLNGAWRGLSGQKNQFGQLAGFAAIICFNRLLARERGTTVALICLAIALVCVALSRSSTSLISTLFALMLMTPMLYAPPAMRRYLPYMAGLFAVIVVIYAVAVLKIVPGLDFLLKPIAVMTGKDLTFSNRTEIWDIVKENIAFHPWLGSGYGGYWVGPVATSPSFQFIARMWFYPSESHNGYLEVANDLGRVGLLILLAFLWMYVRQALALMRVDRAQGVLYLGLFFFQAIMNLSQSCWFATNSGLTVVAMTLSCFTMARALAEAQQPVGLMPARLQPRR